MMDKAGIIVVETHPVQYHAPVYRYLQQRLNIPVTVIYGSDFSICGYFDKEFNTTFSWDSNLLDGYTSVFLSRVEKCGARFAEDVSSVGLKRTLEGRSTRAALVLGYSHRLYQSAFINLMKMKVPILFRGETTDHARHRSNFKSFLRDSILKQLYSKSAALLYVGKRSFGHFKRLGCPDSKMFFSPYCVDTSLFRCDESDRNNLREQTRAKLDISMEKKVILFSGKLSKRKGVDLILSSVKRLPENLRSNLVILFLGDGELKGMLSEFADMAPKITTRFLNFQNQSFLSQYYHAADLLVLPSRHAETWGVVVNEGLHHGLPCVVSTNVGCFPDLIVPGVTGEVFESDLAVSLADAFGRALGLIGQENIRLKCREHVNRYTVPIAAEGIAAAYHTL